MGASLGLHHVPEHFTFFPPLELLLLIDQKVHLLLWGVIRIRKRVLHWEGSSFLLGGFS